MTNFADFGLCEPIMRALEAKGYTTPTPIQAQSIAPLMQGRDLLGIAQTGTGKTAAFALPTLHHLQLNPLPRPAKGCRVLVLSPTRELASQIADSFRLYGRNLRLTVATVFGGEPINRQERQLASGVDVLVATPGRLIDLLERRALGLRAVEVFVLDEADQMLDLGFIHALKRIVQLLPPKRQSLFFSATMPKTIADLAAQFLTNPVRVAVTPVASTAERVEQQVMFCPAALKPAALASVLKTPDLNRALVFTRTKHGADRVVRQLDKAGLKAVAIHGNKSQPQREKALAAFRAGHCPILIATDIAARGIDVAGVSHVINFDLPNVPESYVHRIGRTARAGAEGLAIALCAPDERVYLRDIEKLIRQKVPQVALPEGLDAMAHTIATAPGTPEKAHVDPRAPRTARPARTGDGKAPARTHAGGRPNRGGMPGGAPGGGLAANGPRGRDQRRGPRVDAPRRTGGAA